MNLEQFSKFYNCIILKYININLSNILSGSQVYNCSILKLWNDKFINVEFESGSLSEFK